jgi:hypothetical protein
MERGQSDVPS